MGFLVEEIQNTVELGTLADRHLDRNDTSRERGLDSLVDGIERGVLLVDHRYDEENRVAPRQGFVEHAGGADFYTRCGADDDQRAVGSGQAGNRVTLKIGVARGVEGGDRRLRASGVGGRPAA